MRLVHLLEWQIMDALKCSNCYSVLTFLNPPAYDHRWYLEFLVNILARCFYTNIWYIFLAILSLRIFSERWWGQEKVAWTREREKNIGQLTGSNWGRKWSENFLFEWTIQCITVEWNWQRTTHSSFPSGNSGQVVMKIGSGQISWRIR